jgi:hypothetical protein
VALGEHRRDDRGRVRTRGRGARADPRAGRTFSGNTTGYGGDNFIVNPTDSNVNALSTPNDIATSGSGSTEVTQDPGPTDAFNVQADDGDTWTIKVVAAA